MDASEHRKPWEFHAVMQHVVATSRGLREMFLRVGYYLNAAILLPYGAWVYLHEFRSFSRIPVTIGVLILCVVTSLLYFSTGIRFRLRFLWRRAIVAAALFAILGVGFAGILSAVLFAYACEAISYIRERRGTPRPRVSANFGLGLVVGLAVFVYPLLNEMYYRGTHATISHPDYSRRNIFFGINQAGLRGPVVPLHRSGKVRLLFLGDSSPFGWPYRYQDSYPFVVQDMLRARGMDVEVINAATIGQSDGEIRHQLPYYLAYQPDLVFLMTGIHYLRADADYQRMLREGVSRDTRWRPVVGIPPMLIELAGFSIFTSPLFSKAPDSAQLRKGLESFKVQLRAVVQGVRASGAHLYLLDYPTPGAKRNVQDEVRRVGEEMGIDYVPLFDLVGERIKGHLHDPIHPDREGHRLIAEAVANVVAITLSKTASRRRVAQ